MIEKKINFSQIEIIDPNDHSFWRFNPALNSRIIFEFSSNKQVAFVVFDKKDYWW